MIDFRSPSEKLVAHDATLLESVAGGRIDVAIVLGSGLSFALRDRFEEATIIPYDRLLGVPVAALAGHAHEAFVGTWHGQRVVAFGGRIHLYQGFSPQQVTVNVRLAHAAGAKHLVLTNASGGVNPSFEPGDLMLITDHLNLTGRNPLVGLPFETPFVDMVDAYSPRLREIMTSVARPEHRLRQGVYAGLLGPTYETPAEVHYLRSAGVDAVGMSTVLETIQARRLGMDVLGCSLITNVAAAANTSHEEVTTMASASASRLADLVDHFLAKLP